jgi:large subunit ribosomal protein L31
MQAIMKPGIHPNYQVAQVSCACGNTFTTRSTKPSIKLEICSACHPFYTGRQRLVDTAGRVERFQKRFSKTEGKTVVRKAAVVKLKKLDTLTTTRSARKVLSTAPKKPGSTSKAAPKEKKPAQKKA